MVKKPPIFDPGDGLIVGEVGPWASEKHDRLRRYIDASRGARAKFLPPKRTAGASYIELYSGAGRSVIRDTNQFIEGSAVVAFNAAHASGRPFSVSAKRRLQPAGERKYRPLPGCVPNGSIRPEGVGHSGRNPTANTGAADVRAFTSLHRHKNGVTVS
jgi:hypothetical protein